MSQFHHRIVQLGEVTGLSSEIIFLCVQVHVLVRVPSAGVGAGHLGHAAGHHVHPPLELRREQQEEGQQEDDHP